MSRGQPNNGRTAYAGFAVMSPAAAARRNTARRAVTQLSRDARPVLPGRVRRARATASFTTIARSSKVISARRRSPSKATARRQYGR